MESLSHSESRRKYSWWWDSHISPKNSKWLQENITDMDVKVKSMIKLIEEDADSFARRAEMYYKKRPELMKLVEEFYRAYRALAERYNHATCEHRYAHRTVAKTFPDQIPVDFVEDSTFKSLAQDREPHIPDDDFFEYSRSLPDSEDSEDSVGKRSFIQSNDLFGAKNENKNLKAESEVEGLKKALADVQAEKENVLFEYQRCLEKLSNLEGEFDNAQKDSLGLSEKATQTEIEVQTLNKALIQLETEKKAGFVKHEMYLNKITDLETMVSQVHEETRGFDTRAIGAENEAQILKENISRLKLEKEEVICEYKLCLGKITDLKNVISVLENEVKLLKKQAEKAETEVSDLKRALTDLNKEKEASAFRYNSWLETISNLEKDLSCAKQDVKRLNNEILIGTAKIRNADEKCDILDMSNRSLRVEVDNLFKMIAMKYLEVSEKQEELEKLQISLQNEHLHQSEIEATLETLQNLHSQSQDDQRNLAQDLHNLLQILNESEVSQNGLEEQNLNFSSVVSTVDVQNEILSLRDIKEKLEKEVLHHIDLSNSLHQEILRLKEEIKRLNLSYRDLFEPVEDNSKLREMCDEGKKEKKTLSKKLENMEELLKQKVALESFLSNLSDELKSSGETVKTLQKSCQSLSEQNGTLASEKSSLLSQLQPITENMHKLLERNAILEKSLSNTKAELESLREKSKGLENVCELLKNERSYLLNEKGSLVIKLKNVERKLEKLQKRYMGLEAKYVDVAKEKEAMNFQVKELEISLRVEKQERTSYRHQSETRLAELENEINFLKDENLGKKKEFEEELEKALKAQFEISILYKFIKEMEEKNYTLVIECEKHVEASKLADKLISELESESFEEHVESELLLDEIERLRFGIYQVFRSLEETGQHFVSDEKLENEGISVNHILEIIKNMKFVISKHEDDKQLLLVENSVLLTLLEQMESKGAEIDAQKIYLEEEFKIIARNLVLVKNEKEKLLEMNRQLQLDVMEGHERSFTLESELGSYSVKQADLCKTYTELQEMYSQVNQDNYLQKKFTDLKEETLRVDQGNEAVLLDLFAIGNQSEVLKSFSMEKIVEAKSLLEDLNKQHEINDFLEKEICILREKLELRKAENLLLKDSVDKFKTEIQESVWMRENLEKNMLELSENNSVQKKEIENIHFVNSNLNSELRLLRAEITEKKIRENFLNSELHEKKNELEMWEAEASTFYFDLQISSVREVLFENKMLELTDVCQTLENERDSKISEVEQMKGEICLMMNEVSGLKSQISAYVPVIASLRDGITFLEDNALLQKKLKIAHNLEPEFLEIDVHPSSSKILLEDQTLLSLQNLQTRVITVGKLMEETNKSILKRSNSKSRQVSSINKIEPLKPRQKKGLTPEFLKIKAKASEIQNGTLMKDIPLDQVSDDISLLGSMKGSFGNNDQILEMWEIFEDGQTIHESLGMSYKMTKRDIVYDPPSTESEIEKELAIVSQPREFNDKKILERLASDALKLENLQTTVQDLMMKLEANKNIRKVDFEIVNELLQEADETVVHLVELNGQLLHDLQKCPFPDEKATVQLKETVITRRRKVIEHARKGSERVDRLQVEIQKIQYILLKIEDEKKNKVKNKFLNNKSIILRDFIYNGKKKSGKRKKGPSCGCFKPSSSKNGRCSISSL